MRLSIHSIQATLFRGEAERLIAYTLEGQITVLDHHLPIISTLLGPEIEIVQKNGEKKSVAIASGVLEVRPESDVVILANTR
jgi:F-type H+-transporting ATPase subunit epsilon